MNQITNTLNKKRVYEAPKTRAGKRFIPLTDKLQAILDTQRQAQRRERVKAGAAWQGAGGVDHVLCTAVFQLGRWPAGGRADGYAAAGADGAGRGQ